MQIYPNRLSQQLAQGLPRFALIFGDEPQQKLDAIDSIRRLATQQGFDERHSLVADKQFEWSSLIEATQTLSLFASRQLIELELPTAKPGTEGSKVLVNIASQDNPDILIVIHGPKADKGVTNSKWFKQLDKQGIYVPCYPLEGDRLAAWIREQMQQLQLQPDNQVVNFFADYFEGNLLAAKQELQKLPLLFPDGKVALDRIDKVLVDQSRYNVFQLADTLLAGDAQKSVRLLNRLEAEGLEPTIILWALVREWQNLHSLHTAMARKQPLDKLWNQLRIWQNRRGLYQNALRRIDHAQLEQIRQKLTELDSAVKQSQLPRPYVELCHACLLFIPMQLNNIPLDYSTA